MLSEGNYTELSSSPLNKMKKNVLDVLKKHSNVIDKTAIWKLKHSNSQVPRMYGLDYGFHQQN